jgi:hypothetical protein
MSKPFFCAVCCEVGPFAAAAPFGGVPAGGVALVEGIGVEPGGGSGGPLRPHAASANAAAVSTISAKATLRRLKAKRLVPQELLQHSRSHRSGEILAITPCHRVYCPR